MSFEVDVSTSIDESKWNENLVKNRGATAYQIPSYSYVYSQTFDSKPFFIYVRHKGEIVGQLSAIIHAKYNWKATNFISKFLGSNLNLNKVLRWEYGPIIHDHLHHEEILSEILSAIDTIAKQNKVIMIRGTTSPLDQQLSSQTFQKYGYEEKKWATYITDLNQSVDLLYNTLSKETRYDIRKAEKNGLEFSVIDEFSSFNEHNELALEVRKMRGDMAKKYYLFDRKFWDTLYGNGYLKVLQVRKNGILLGGIDALIFNGNLIQYSVVAPQKGQKLQAGTFLTWNAIRWSIDMKYKTYDMGGINPEPENEKEKSINFYKSKWGGKQLNYIRYVKVLDNFRLKLSSAVTNPRKVTSKINKILR